MHCSSRHRDSAHHWELLFRAQLIFCPCFAFSSSAKLLAVHAVLCGGLLQGPCWPLSNTPACLTLSWIIFWPSSSYPAIAAPGFLGASSVYGVYMGSEGNPLLWVHRGWQGPFCPAYALHVNFVLFPDKVRLSCVWCQEPNTFSLSFSWNCNVKNGLCSFEKKLSWFIWHQGHYVGSEWSPLCFQGTGGFGAGLQAPAKGQLWPTLIFLTQQTLKLHQIFFLIENCRLLWRFSIWVRALPP